MEPWQLSRARPSASVEFRIENDAKAIHNYVVVDETVVRRRVGGPVVMSGQLQHLLNMAKRPRVDLRVVPFAAGATPA